MNHSIFIFKIPYILKECGVFFLLFFILLFKSNELSASSQLFPLHTSFFIRSSAAVTFRKCCSSACVYIFKGTNINGVRLLKQYEQSSFVYVHFIQQL